MRHSWLGSILLSTALGSPAATLGSYDGLAWLGRPLDIKVRVALAPGDVLSELCIRPEVFYGDMLVAPSTVSATLVPSASDTDATLRIRSTQPINEPIVTVSVSIGCGSVFSRRYVLLADPVDEVVQAERGVPEVVVVPVPAPAPQPQVETQAPSPRASRAEPRRPARAARQAERPQASASARKTESRPAKEESKPVTSRLKLDPLDIELTTEQASPASTASAEQATPAGGSPEAAQPDAQPSVSQEEVLRYQQRIGLLEAESKTLRELEARSRQRLEALEARLEAAERGRWTAYVLSGMLALGLLAALWRRKPAPQQDEPTGRPSWAGAVASRFRSSRHSKLDEGLEEVSVPPAVAAPVQRKKVVTPVDIELHLDDDSQPIALEQPIGRAGGGRAAVPKADADLRELAPAPAIAARSLATEELFDVQQQADFFMSLGDHEQAIRVLREHLEESHEPSPLTYLDLFKIYHELGRREEYEALRADFNVVFNAGAPPFEQYSAHSRGLESYEKAFSRIQALWPQPKVLDVIERSIFRDQQMADDEVFDLEAYRELLLLYAIAKDAIEREAPAAEPAAPDFQNTALKPLNAATYMTGLVMGGGMSGKETEPPEGGLSPLSSNIGLDIDLEALEDAEVFEASLPAAAEPENLVIEAQASGDAASESNLIDFELLDFTPPDEEDSSGSRV